MQRNPIGLVTGMLLATAVNPQDAATPRPGELVFETGRVAIDGGIASLDLPPGLRFLQREHARLVLETLWGNPAEDGVCGLVVPDGVPLDRVEWALVVAHVEPGHVDVGDVDALDPALALTALQDDVRRESADRIAAGTPPMAVLDWHDPPRYDARTHRLSWATELQFAGDDEVTVNLHHRLLGRTGHLEFTTLSHGNPTEAAIRRAEGVVVNTRFAPGRAYEDFRPGVDPRAPFGLLGLILGNEPAPRSDASPPAGVLSSPAAGAAAAAALALLGLLALRRRRGLRAASA